MSAEGVGDIFTEDMLSAGLVCRLSIAAKRRKGILAKVEATGMDF